LPIALRFGFLSLHLHENPKPFEQHVNKSKDALPKILNPITALLHVYIFLSFIFYFNWYAKIKNRIKDHIIKFI
tara:strand:+ start:135 stop:356 length:222 start_codon:yes stop_codon:yes gene_type:complete